MNEKEVKPPVTTVTRKIVGEEEQEQPVTMGNIAIVALIVALSTPVMLLIGHALPLLDSFFNGMKPLVSYIGFCTGVALFALLILSVWYVHDRFRVDIKRRIIEAGKFQVDSQSGNYDAYLDEKKQFLVPNPGTLVQPVPQTITLAPQWHLKGSVNKVEEKSSQPLLEQGNVQRPSVDELASKIERNSLQIGLGRSLTNPKEDIIADISSSHIKIIGTTQMGKSCEAGSILAQIEKTHDPNRLQFALLDRENKVSRFFEKSHHLARVDIGRGKQAFMHAKSLEEIPVYLHYLAEELERRSAIEDAYELEQLPHILIYFEEFLDTKNHIKAQGGKVCTQFLTDFTSIATRGLKTGLHFMACTQADYSDEDIKEAMKQFYVNIAFSVAPSVAFSAGFLRNDLVRQNFASKIPGQFVVEMIGGADLGIAPNYDVKTKLQALSQTKILGMRETRDLSLETSLQEGGNQLEPALQAIVADLDGEQWVIEQFSWKLDQLKDLLHTNQNEQFDQIWGVSPGSGREYKKAKAERTALIEHMKSLLGKVA